MANNIFSTAEQSSLDRMKALMNYGRVNENKQSYSGIENTKVAADKKTYGIIREGSKYYIKVSDKKQPLVEDFNYIGGFRNRKDYEYDSFANAQKNFEMKIKSVNEAYRTPAMVVESWENKGENNQAITESTKKMQDEIARQREIMFNVNAINENKSQVLRPINEKKESCASAPFCENPDKEFKDSQDNNIKNNGTEGNGDAKKANDGYKKATTKNSKIVGESEEVLGFNRGNDDYMDKSHGTEIGDSAPFDDAEGRNIDNDKETSETGEMKNGVIKEGESMHDTDNQNSPAPGTGEIGDNQPFDGEKGRDIDEAIEDIDVDIEDEDGDEDFDFSDEEEVGGDMDDLSADEMVDDADDAPVDDEIVDDDDDETVEERLSDLESLMAKIAEKLGVGTYEDEDLYDDSDEDIDGEGGFDVEVADEEPEADEELEDCVAFESKAYKAMKLAEAKKRVMRRAVNEATKLDDFGKHPAYQKKVMQLPPKDMQDKEGYYDMNDDSVKSDAPYGRKIGSSAPFTIDIETIENAITESINKVLKKK